MSIKSKLQQFVTDYPLSTLDVCMGVDEDMPCLVLYAPGTNDQIARIYMAPEAAEKLAAQAMAAAMANEYEKTAAALRHEIVQSRSRCVAGQHAEASQARALVAALRCLPRDEPLLTKAAVEALGPDAAESLAALNRGDG